VGVQHARNLQIVDVLAFTLEQPPIFDTKQRLTNQAIVNRRHRSDSDVSDNIKGFSMATTMPRLKGDVEFHDGPISYNERLD
jgi:hypothetical protein